MKKIIAGAKYDTDTAKELGYSSNNCSQSDFNWYSETLYRTKSGRYFLAGEGGARSRYARSCGNNSWTGGSGIEPMSREAAQKWAEEHLDSDKYEAIFGEVTEDEQEQLNVLVSSQLKQKLWELAEKQGKSMSTLAEEILAKEF